MNVILPKEVKEVISKLTKAGFEAYVVGGCVRDLFLKKEPDDWEYIPFDSARRSCNV